MKHRIRAAALVVHDDRLLLVKSRIPHTGGICGLPDEYDVLEAVFLSRKEMADLTVYPEQLKDEFWDDLESGLVEPRFLGVRCG